MKQEKEMKEIEILSKLMKEIEAREESQFSPYATRNKDAWRLKEEAVELTRTPFAQDRDRIVYSGAYRRYQGKTQVFYFANILDEDIATRSLHTTYVSQISRTIGKLLGLNLDLIEAIALSHDLGHTPFGHDGEFFLSELCRENGIGEFHHNVHGLHIVDHVSNKGKGMNLTFQVRDGIVSHDGEVHNQVLVPDKNKTEQDLQEYIRLKTEGENVTCTPSTLEGCVVRFSDTIAYIGKDIEDAIRAGLIEREAIPQSCYIKLGDRNSRIIDTLVKSLVVSSYKKNSISFEEEVSEELRKLKDFNYEFIYSHSNLKRSKVKIGRGFKIMFEVFLEDLKEHRKDSKIFKHFLKGRSTDYMKNNSYPMIVRDFIASMTDRYFQETLQDFILPDKLLE